ncbi:MAG: HupE/UreJ family protein [Rhizobacter sp.]|nr:HupE/UreJ family protein [Burkholderiaceae bacterium]MCO5123670.1 HupE/UreJ family protein [Rhizobacter sp.]
MRQGHSTAARSAIAIFLLLAGANAEAHLESTGMGPVYDGALHFLTSPEDLVPALALALLAGLRGAEHGRRVLFTLPAAWLLGSLAGLATAATGTGLLGPALWLVLLGGLVVFDAKLSLGALTALAALMGLFHGYLNGSGMGLALPAVVAMAGLAASVFVVVALVAAAIVPLRAAWVRIAVRVGGSWIAASGLLMLGWSMRGS